MLSKKLFRFRVTGITKNPHAQNADVIYDQLTDKAEKFTVFLVREEENRYDENAIRVMVPSPVGRLCIGYIPAVRICPICDPLEQERGYRAYGELKVDSCPKCKTALMKAYNEMIAPLLGKKSRVEATAFFIGRTEGKANLGAVIEAAIFIEEDE